MAAPRRDRQPPQPPRRVLDHLAPGIAPLVLQEQRGRSMRKSPGAGCAAAKPPLDPPSSATVADRPGVGPQSPGAGLAAGRSRGRPVPAAQAASCCRWPSSAAPQVPVDDLVAFRGEVRRVVAARPGAPLVGGGGVVQRSPPRRSATASLAFVARAAPAAECSCRQQLLVGAGLGGRRRRPARSRRPSRRA